ncbi:phage tail protein [Methylobacterium sp. W2]|uniref:phage tail protein n=1 Tax=Methylobacterium sp. W2 TaxID=2598107 RepID=UPI001D0C8A83|nr:phage tail protein [Methylobacterium sp. W2]MCC0809318.1 phage tail protein [Methylobacterium sp. W2]
MDQLLRLTLLLSRWTRRRWTRMEAIVAVSVIAFALIIGIIEWAGYWPDALVAEKVRRAPMRF